jgi:hypothetical protein
MKKKKEATGHIYKPHVRSDKYASKALERYNLKEELGGGQ